MDLVWAFDTIVRSRFNVMNEMASLNEQVKVYVSTIPGLEFICVSECDETFHSKAKKEGRGRVSFFTEVCYLQKLSELRSVHHYWLEVFQSSTVLEPGNCKEDELQRLEDLMNNVGWFKALYAFKHFIEHSQLSWKGKAYNGDKQTCLQQQHQDENDGAFISAETANTVAEILKHDVGMPAKEQSLDFRGSEKSSRIIPTDDDDDDDETCDRISDNFLEIGKKRNSLDDKNQKPYSEFPSPLHPSFERSSEVKFRVTCRRNGKHNFTSMEAAKFIGSGIKTFFEWDVDLENFDIEILAFIDGTEVTIAIKLSNESKHSRNVKFFGPTTLQATTSYCMLKLAGIKPGDIVCDPMCGSGSICLEGVSSFPFTFQIGGEIHPDGCQNAGNNFEHFHQNQEGDAKHFNLPHNILQWDACHLPLRDGFVDAVVCDLPFGKRIGYKGRNFLLYPSVLKEMGRICRPRGKAVLLTQHKSAMNKALSLLNEVWKKQSSFFINMGGLNVAIYVLKRQAAKRM